MVDIETARQMAMALPGTIEKDHFGIPSFRANNRIFSTLWTKENRMMVELPPIEQSAFHSFDPTVFYPVPNKWGHKGATFVELSKVDAGILQDALAQAWRVSGIKEKQVIYRPAISILRSEVQNKTWRLYQAHSQRRFGHCDS